MGQKRIYMDHAAGMPVDPRVFDAMKPYMERVGNPSSLNSSGVFAKKAMEDARKKVANLVGAAKPDEIIFLSGATEANNLAIKGTVQRNAEKGKHIITTKIEHMSVLNTCKFLENNGFSVTYLPVDRYGTVDMDALRGAITDKTVLITLAYANGEIGTIQPIKEIGAIARGKKIMFHVDGTAAIGKIPVNVVSDNIDLLTISSNDIYGPQGVGAIYIRTGVKIMPQIQGGGQERGLRSGTENVAGIVGFGMAAEIAKSEMGQESGRLVKLRDALIEKLTKIDKSFLNGHPVNRLPNSVNVRFSYIEGESIILNLDMAGVEAATSSACTSKTLEPSHVLLAMGISHADSQGALLLTLGRSTTMEDVNYVATEVPKIVERMRSMSPIAAHPELLDVAYDKEEHEDEDKD